MQRPAPTGGSSHHERQREIDKRGSSHSAGSPQSKTRVRQENADSANQQADETDRVDPVSNADESGVPRSIQNVRVSDREPGEVCGLRHNWCGVR